MLLTKRNFWEERAKLDDGSQLEVLRCFERAQAYAAGVEDTRADLDHGDLTDFENMYGLHAIDFETQASTYRSNIGTCFRAWIAWEDAYWEARERFEV